MADGWGGPAKGAGTGGERATSFAVRQPAANATAENRDPGEQAYRAQRRRLKRDRTVAMEDRLYEIGMGEAAATPVAVNALAKLHAIWNGLPVATNVNLTADDVTALSDDELRAELARISGEGGPAVEGTDAAAE